MTNGNHEGPAFNFERLALIYSPLFIAWWIGMRSISKQLDNSIAGLVLSTAVIAVVFVLVRRIEVNIYNGEEKTACIKYLIMAILPLFVTIAANFNLIYPNMMKSFLLREELESKRFSLQQANAEAIKKLSSPELVEWYGKLDGLRAQLTSQINSPSAQGVGKRAEAIIVEIETHLGQKITRHPGLYKKQSQQIADIYNSDIAKLIESNPRAVGAKERNSDLATIRKKVDKTVEMLDAAAKDISADTQESTTVVTSALKEAVDRYEEIVSVTKRHVPDAFQSMPQKLHLENGEMGKISHTLKSAGAHMHVEAMWLAVFFSLLIDLWAVVMAFFYTTKKKYSHQEKIEKLSATASWEGTQMRSSGFEMVIEEEATVAHQKSEHLHRLM